MLVVGVEGHAAGILLLRLYQWTLLVLRDHLREGLLHYGMLLRRPLWLWYRALSMAERRRYDASLLIDSQFKLLASWWREDSVLLHTKCDLLLV